MVGGRVSRRSGDGGLVMPSWPSSSTGATTDNYLAWFTSGPVAVLAERSYLSAFLSLAVALLIGLLVWKLVVWAIKES